MKPGGLMGWARSALSRFSALEQRLDRIQLALARIERELQLVRGVADPAAREMRVFSQWGEDGIIQAIVSQISLGPGRFVEFGVEDYREANTRFLLQDGYWSGLVLDGSAENVARIVRDPISWRHDLRARCVFVTRDNINALLSAEGFDGDLDLLSIDLDGNDYWIWEAVTVATPRIVVVEYNSVFGPDLACTIPYRADFRRTVAHPSNLYYGASVAAFYGLARARGYRLVCGNRAGNNLFFVREDVAGDLPRRSPAEAWAQSRFRETRDDAGTLLYARADEARGRIEHLPLVDLTSGTETTLAALLAAQ